MALQLVWKRRYPEADVYAGSAHELNLEWYALPEPLDFENVAEQVLNYQVQQEGGKTLETSFWREVVYNIFGYPILYRYRLQSFFHGSPLNPYIILAAIIAILIIIWLVTSEIKQILWGPSDGDRGFNPWEVLQFFAISGVIVAGAGAAIYLLKELRASR